MKSLIIREKVNIFQKIRMFFTELFHKKENEKHKNTENTNVVKELRKENEIITLQRKYENGHIKEENMTETEKEELLLLYKKQIKNLEDNVVNYQRIIQNYKTKIMEKRKNFSENN